MSEMSLGLSEARLQGKPEATRRFFDVSVLKLAVMSTVTFGLYQIYWFYRNWRMAKERGEDVIPFLRAIFGVLFAYPLFKEIRQTGRTASVTAVPAAGGLAFLYIVLQFTWRLPDPLWLIGFSTVVPLAIVQRDVAKVHQALGVDPNVNNRFTAANIAGILIGGALIALIVVGLFLPPVAE